MGLCCGRSPTPCDGRAIFPLTAHVSPKPEFYLVLDHEDFRTRLLLPEVFPAALLQQDVRDRHGQAYVRLYL